MFGLTIACLVTLFCVSSVYCQIPPGYTCVPAGTCNINNGIDIRIVTPGNVNPCPPGQVLCPISATPTPTPTPTPSPTTCGTRGVANINPADGFATPGAYPWQAYLVNQTGYAGSGVLINPNTVLTAAHKVYMNAATPNQVGVYMGVYDSAQLGLRYAVSSITIHPGFNPATLFNDIAILRLSAPIAPLPQQFINTACLPTAGQSFVGQTCSVSGWGQTAFNVNDAPTRQQKQVGVTIVNYATCYASMSNATLLGTNVNLYLDPVGEICAGGQAMRDACTQDGGSPLVCLVNGRFVVAGLVAWGKGCGQAGVYGVYVNVPNYITWIQNTLATLNG
ncbi:hypothetical protein ILUMI_01016 [Ignelater luminosus]|uniref:Peptidase S1 domain-containing protein n=1 Tax=Ignelater luminosus TaxID=2038154 RepID=A0A8K0GML7_IGNLU|nr:hypothetical protein ILUMI_01016 [Ignelater luminosus]